MEFKIKKNELINLLDIVNKAAPSVTTLPVLTGIIFVIKNNSIVLTSSDSKFTIIKTLIKDNDKFEVKEEGKFLLDSKLITEITKKIDGEYINFEIIDGNLIKIYSNNSKFKINCLDIDKYPELEIEENNEKFKINPQVLKSIINKVAYACSEKGIRPCLTGINLSSISGKLYASATDSFQFASKYAEIELSEDFNITVSKKYLLDTVSCCDKEKEVDISITDRNIIFYFNNTVIQISIFDDAFPDTKNFYSINPEQNFTIDTSILIKMIERCSLIKDDGKSQVTLYFEVDQNKILLKAQNSISSFNDEDKPTSFNGDKIEFSCNGLYMLNALKTIDSKEVYIGFSSRLKPIIIKNINDESSFILVSPLRSGK